MDIQIFREYCLSKKLCSEETPFGPNTLVFKVHNKIFALCTINNFSDITLKCDPEIATDLRATYLAVKPGYHTNKKHWNTVTVNQDVNDTLLIEMIDNSYNLVVQSLPIKTQQLLFFSDDIR